MPARTLGIGMGYPAIASPASYPQSYPQAGSIALRHGDVRHAVLRHAVLHHAVLRHGAVRHGVVPCDTVHHGAVRGARGPWLGEL